jgi:hypothetical protein
LAHSLAKRRALSGLTAFALAMLALQCGRARWLDPPRCTALESKWRDFERDADAYDVVFIGTSHIQRHIDPRAIDRTLADQGIALRSYNFGLPKMSLVECAQLIDRIAERRPRRLKLVVLEPTLYLYDADNWATDRAMASHDWSNAWRAAQLTWNSEDRRGTSAWGKINCVRPHLLSLVCRLLGLRRAESLFSPASIDRTRQGRSGSKGFLPLPVIAQPAGSPVGWQCRFARFLEIEPDWTGPPLSQPELDYFDGLIEQIRRLRATPVFLLGPKVKRDSHTAAVLRSHRESYAGVPLLDYVRGHGCSEIYEIRYWHDFDHLNADGARLFSRRVALQLAPILAESVPDPSLRP